MDLKKLASWFFVIGTISLIAGLVVGIATFDIAEFREDVEKMRAIGGDMDEGGCLIGAGYSWCEEKEKCLRVWEEPCE